MVIRDQLYRSVLFNLFSLQPEKPITQMLRSITAICKVKTKKKSQTLNQQKRPLPTKEQLFLALSSGHFKVYN